MKGREYKASIAAFSSFFFFYLEKHMYYDELYHHGILGQKWGVRRYQNKDGSLTAAGKKRRDRYERAADAAERDADDLRKHGYIKEAEAVQRVADKNRSKSKTANAGPNNREDQNKAHDKSKNKSVESMSGADRNKLQRRAAAGREFLNKYMGL